MITRAIPSSPWREVFCDEKPIDHKTKICNEGNCHFFGDAVLIPPRLATWCSGRFMHSGDLPLIVLAQGFIMCYAFCVAAHSLIFLPTLFLMRCSQGPSLSVALLLDALCNLVFDVGLVLALMMCCCCCCFLF
ncbi:hypothetical protein TraAM80_04632 [Trypanosoma rangeli]|uniref:Uncharacterized protein n=1 Tax=Trypanosoma rangeli TaxID=5698 RepID=A0A422NIW4_TRYRA|nr:uncharacterized protein TraAM80_04632 [Trypanosoma rangeli]RNF05422.1 hypothetical protein TraAM80_04632 [Trypanosoma rangeli]|eukprot:RNF05422.1 hypothetical protein TraAM80_04632 [Trypanosoma rangeli]